MKTTMRCVIAGGFALLLALAARGQLTSYTVIDYAEKPTSIIQALGSNDTGDICGAYFGPEGARYRSTNRRVRGLSAAPQRRDP